VILFRKIVDDETVPMDWKEANIVPILRRGQRSAASNYRSVSLTSQTCKVFEAVVRDEVVEFLDKRKLIRDSQHGFRKGRSCLTNLLLDEVLRSVGGVVFLYLANVFDKVPHGRLLEKLRKRSIGGKLLGTIGDWLRNRRQRVCIKGKQFTWGESLQQCSSRLCFGAPVILDFYIKKLEDNTSVLLMIRRSLEK